MARTRSGLVVKMFGPVIADVLGARARRERLVELVNNCQHAPYPEGRTCDAGGFDKDGGINGIRAVGGVPLAEWLANHGISPAVMRTRGYDKWEKTGEAGLDPAISEAYGSDMATMTQMRSAAAQTSGIIMPRHAVPGSSVEERKGILPQTRPDVPVIPASEINGLRKELAREGVDLERDVFDDPDSELAQAVRADHGAKYLFPAGKGNAARVDLPPDAQNVKNFVEGKGRVYLAMEGSIKTDAVLTAIQREGEVEASVVGVPSVTLWHTPEMREVASKYLQGREVVLIPDADGVTNKDVRNQSRALQNLLELSGAGKVLVAAPPLDSKGEIINVTLPSGKEEHLKGVDDYLGAGKGSLGGLAFVDRVAPQIDLGRERQLGESVGLGDPVEWKRLTTSNRQSAEDTLRAVAMLAVPETGEVRVGTRTLGAAIGADKNVAQRGLDRLVALGLLRKENLSEMSNARKDELVARGIIEKIPKGGGGFYRGGKKVKGPRLETATYMHDGKPVTVSRWLVPKADLVEDNDWVTMEEDSPEIPVYTIVRKKHRARDSALDHLAGRPGIKEIRTAAGEERYGGQIGDVIKAPTKAEKKKAAAKAAAEAA